MELELEPLRLPSDQERPIVIAGPCSAETEEQVMTTAKQLAEKGCHMFRAGVWKPRTKPGGFEGNGETALPWMKQVKEETGMLTATEVATPEHVELALKYGIDCAVDRCPHFCQPIRHAGIGRQSERCRCACVGQEPSQSRPGTLDRSLAAYQSGWYQALGSHPSWFLKLRQEDLSQPAYVADSYRTASPHSSVAYRLRPKPHRWTSRLDSTIVSAGYGSRF